jgi:hypothetical protein
LQRKISPADTLKRLQRKESPTNIMSATLTLQGDLLTKCVQIMIIITFIRNLAAAKSCHDYYPLASFSSLPIVGVDRFYS